MINSLTINTDTAKYHARAWRTEVLREQAKKEVTKMLQAFVPEGFQVKVVEQEHEVPGFPFALPYKFRATLQDAKPNGSDAHIMTSGYTWEGAEARLLAAIIEGRGFTPMT